MKKILDIKRVDQDIIFSPVTAFLFGILKRYNNKNIDYWIISNFINTYIDITLIDPDIPDDPLVYEEFFRQSIWYDCPFIEQNKIDVGVVKHYWSGNFVEFCKKLIDLDYYIYADINKSIIPNYNSTDNFVHNMLIYGYDAEKNTINIADYFRGRKFSFEECLEKELNDAFDGLDKIGDYKRFSNVNFIRYRDEHNYNFSISEIKSKLIDYRDSVDLIKKYHHSLFAYEYRDSGKVYCGIKYYDALCEALILERPFSIKPFQLLVMNKSIMCKRISILQNEYFLTDKILEERANELLRKTIILRNLVFKLNYKYGEERILNDTDKTMLMGKIRVLQEEDYRFVSDLVKELP